MKISKRVSEIRYAIRDLDTNEKGIIKLNIGDPAIFDFRMPSVIVKALKKAVDNGNNYYTESQGVLELREAICQKARSKNIFISPRDIIVTSGTSEAVNILFACLVHKGREVLLPSPTYPQYSSLVSFYDGKPVYYKCSENEGWQPDVNDIEKKISRKTCAIVIINPNNPTGAVYSEETLRKIIEIAVSSQIPIISDEIYDEITYDKPAIPVASLAKESEARIITLNGMSKNYLAPGWRIGWIMLSNFGNSVLREALLKLCRLRLCANSPAQFAISKTLKVNNNNKEITKRLRERRDFVLERIEKLNEISPSLKFSCAVPQGAFYAFVRMEDLSNIWKDDLEFVKELRDKAKVLVVHGSGFGYQGKKKEEKYFRIVFLPHEKILNEAFRRISGFVRFKLNQIL